MTPEQLQEALKAIDHAEKQSDRWLFLLALLFICGCGIAIIRYLVRQNEKQSDRHSVLTEKFLVAWTESTAVIKEVRDWLTRHGAKLLLVFLVLAMSGTYPQIDADLRRFEDVEEGCARHAVRASLSSLLNLRSSALICGPLRRFEDGGGVRW